MSPALQSVQLFLLAGCAFLLAGSLFAALLVRQFGARLTGLEPQTRYRALVLLALAPLASAGALLFTVSLPSLLALANPRWDHCLSHDDGHAHLCFVHLPTAGMNAALQLSLVVAVSFVCWRALLSITSLLRATQVLRVLVRTGQRHSEVGVTVLDTTQPVCLAAGLLHPTVLISRGLLDALSADERSIVLAHERAHVRRRDALTASFVRACAVFHLPHVGAWIVREHAIAAEQVCDEEAATSIGDRLAVAAAILTAERVVQNGPPLHEVGGVAVAFGLCAVERRVESLLAPRAPAPRLRRFYFGLSLAVLALLLASDPLHHATETLLSYVAHG